MIGSKPKYCGRELESWAAVPLSDHTRQMPGTLRHETIYHNVDDVFFSPPVNYFCRWFALARITECLLIKLILYRSMEEETDENSHVRSSWRIDRGHEITRKTRDDFFFFVFCCGSNNAKERSVLIVEEELYLI